MLSYYVLMGQIWLNVLYLHSTNIALYLYSTKFNIVVAFAFHIYCFCILYSTNIVFAFVFHIYIVFVFVFHIYIVISSDALLSLRGCIASFHEFTTNVCLVLVQTRKTRPDMIEELLTGTLRIIIK